MKSDIQNRADIELLVNTFYEKVKVDETIGYFFDKVIPVHWDKHLPIMYNFWENIVFSTGVYEGNPMVQHHNMHQKSPMSKVHFDQWVKLFTKTVNELFEGDNAELIKQRATSIATVMQIKILH
ncbi:MAG: group III truncated hemoglobin [Ferruginibacter sp.]|nr:group III truncated hemoglobin [Ferruginibacter sp.]